MDFTLYKSQLKSFFSWLIPAKCAWCKSSINGLASVYCRTCTAELPYLDRGCQRCGQAFSGFSDYCGRCLCQPPIFDACFCAFDYCEPISDDIRRLKYGEQPQLAKRLAALLVDELAQQDIEMPDALVSVPMHISKLKIRGFNQSHELAKCLSKQLGIPLLRGAIRKNKATPPQATQTRAQRKTNLIGSFSMHKKPISKHVAIIDDVVTSGATAEEIAKILKKNGVDYVQVWGIARTS